VRRFDRELSVTEGTDEALGSSINQKVRKKKELHVRLILSGLFQSARLSNECCTDCSGGSIRSLCVGGGGLVRLVTQVNQHVLWKDRSRFDPPVHPLSQVTHVCVKEREFCVAIVTFPNLIPGFLPSMPHSHSAALPLVLSIPLLLHVFYSYASPDSFSFSPFYVSHNSFVSFF